MTDYYVDSEKGKDRWSGTAKRPFATLDRAIAERMITGHDSTDKFFVISHLDPEDWRFIYGSCEMGGAGGGDGDT